MGYANIENVRIYRAYPIINDSIILLGYEGTFVHIIVTTSCDISNTE